MAPGYQNYFGGSARSIWILLKDGSKVWPVFVVDNDFADGWDDF